MAKRNISGIFLLDKPEGITSSTALVRTRAIFKAKKGGHTGALDPLASGLLPICLGEAAKFSSFFLEGRKRYIAEGILGRTTTTVDREGETVIERPIGDASECLEEVLPQFRGLIMQVPPLYSAVKVNGKPLYKYARQGCEQEVEIPSRQVEILELKLLERTANTFKVEVYCSKGTYIRTLISDIGEALGCGAYVSYLRRIAVDGLPEGQMITLDQLQAITDARTDPKDFSTLDALLLPLDQAVKNLPMVQLPVNLAEPLCHGMRLEAASLQTAMQAGEVQVTMIKKSADNATNGVVTESERLFQVRCAGVFVGVCRFDTMGRLVPHRMMGPEVIDCFINSSVANEA